MAEILVRLRNRVVLYDVMITYNIYIVIRETGQFSSKGIINDFIGNLNRLCFTAIHRTSCITNSALDIKIPKYSENTIK